MHRVIVDIMPRTDAFDTDGRAITGVLPKIGFDGFADVRVGRRFELSTRGPVTDEVLATVRRLAEEILANPLYDDVVGVYAAGGAAPGIQGDAGR